MTTRIVQSAAWAMLAFIIFATVSPISERPHDYLPVQVDRALAFAVMSAAFILGYPKYWRSVTMMCVIAAFAIESLQFLSPTRHAQINDACVKALGVIVGMPLGIAANKTRERLRHR